MSQPNGMDRRDLLRLLAAAPLPALLPWPAATIDRARRTALDVTANGAAFAPAFFSEEEWATVRLLADLIIPRDQRSGSAGDAGVPEFIDTLLADGSEAEQTRIRGGLAWLERECRERYGAGFTAIAPSPRTELLDAVAWPDRAAAELSQGVRFFSRFRDLVAAGFWSSRLGMEDLGYQGNTFVTEWQGCPTEQLQRYGVAPREQEGEA